MATVTFLDPTITRAANGQFEYDPTNPGDFSNVPKKPGIYIYGLKINIVDNRHPLFVPLYVGNDKSNIQQRIIEHYTGMYHLGSSRKELFEILQKMSQNEIKSLYDDMAYYDSFGKGNASDGKENPLDERRLNINSLIWFNNAKFFDIKLKLKIGTSKYLAQSGHLASIYPIIGDLCLIGTPESLVLKNGIKKVKNLFTTNFHFVYTTYNQINSISSITIPALEKGEDKKKHTAKLNNQKKLMLSDAESATKIALKEIGIHTTAAAKKKLSQNMVIDLSQIQNDLVNLVPISSSGIFHQTMPNTNYINPLIIPIP